MSKIISEMKEQYELIVLDCPPVILFADSLILGSIATGTILVYQAGRMARSALKRSKDQLAKINVNVLGVILNDITTSDMEPHYSYGYNYSYKYYAKEPLNLKYDPNWRPS